CSWIAPVPAEDGTRETASFTGPPLHRTPTTRLSRSWHSVMDHKTHSSKSLSTISNALLQPSRRLGALPGQFLPSPHTGDPLPCFVVHCLPFLISCTWKTRALLRWPASRSTTNRHSSTLESRLEHHASRFHHRERGTWRRCLYCCSLFPAEIPLQSAP